MDIIFDLDGTLWDSSEIVLKAWNDVFIKNNLNTINKNDLAKVLGLDMVSIFNKLQPGADKKVLDEMMEYEDIYLKKYKIGIYKNTIKTIKFLSDKYRLFIVSNCQKGYIDVFLDLYDLRKYFVDYLCWGDTKTIKGKTIKTLMDKNNITNACYVGDTSGDKEAALYAEIPFIYAKYGFGDVKEYDYCIDDISVLKTIIEKI